MNKDIADRWVTALRSDKFDQGTDNLCKDGRFCCLGVLCELYMDEFDLADEFSEPALVKDKHGEEREVVYYGGADDLLPNEVQEWAGMQTHNGTIVQVQDKIWDNDTSLAELNDDGMSFKDIADIIEKEWMHL